MAKNIDLLFFDNKSNVYDFPTESAYAESTEVNFEAGNDRVSARSGSEIGLLVSDAVISAGKGNDTLSGTSDDEDGLHIDGGSEVYGDEGNDLFLGVSTFRDGLHLQEDSTLSGGSGNDTIAGTSVAGRRGLVVENSTLDAGTGNDSVYGSGSHGSDYSTSHGIEVYNFSLIELGSGNDTLEGHADNAGYEVDAVGVGLYGESDLEAGSGNDHLNAYAYSDASGGLAGAFALEIQDSLLILEAGNDCVYGEAVSSSEEIGNGEDWDAEAYGLFMGEFHSSSDAATILGGAGNDTLAFNAVATGEDNYAAGVGIYGESVVDLGDGADCVAGYGSGSNPYSNFGYAEGVGVDIDNGARLQMGNGNDTVNGEAVSLNSGSEESESWATGIWVGEFSALEAGAGADKIIGTANASGEDYAAGTGIWIDDSSDLSTGSGNDFVSGTGIVSRAGDEGDATGIYNDAYLYTSDGNDQVVGYGYDDTEEDNVDAYGIYNDDDGDINLGAGNDRLTGVGDGYGIYNNGYIFADAGNDIVDVSASEFGFGTDSEGNLIDLYTGNDTVRGFGFANIDGGDGTDTLRLAEGVYDWDGSGYVSGGDTELYIDNFERIGAYGGGTLNLANLTDSGTFTVTANRITFA